MTWKSKQQNKIFVVDSDIEGYEGLTSLEVVFFCTGREALRASSQPRSAVWLINIALPDMNGIELRGMLLDRQRAGCVAMVSNQYCIRDELAARSAGVEAYFAKPVPWEWTLGWVGSLNYC